MSRKRTEAATDSGDEFNVESIGARDFAQRYLPPGGVRPRWQLPSNARIIEDFKQCGSDLSIYLHAVAPNNLDRHSRQILLSSIILQLKEDNGKAFELFNDARTAGEEARLLLVEESLMTEASRGDTVAMKFVLEKRRSHRFGKGGTVTGGDDDDFRNLINAIRGNKNGKEEADA